MKKKLLTIGACVAAALILMFVEYRFIMVNLHPFMDNDTMYIEFMGQVDEYNMED